MIPITECTSFRLGPLEVSRGCAVRVMAIINVSPESFFRGSVAADASAVREAAARAATEGADLLDIGAMSTAPYKETWITPEEEAERLGAAIAAAREACALPISADTSRVLPARVALDAGACIINDISGLAGDRELAPLAATRAAGVVLMANEGAAARRGSSTPLDTVAELLHAAVLRARAAGIPDERLVLDPGLGFFRNQGIPWHDWDLRVLGGLDRLAALGFPLLVSASRKSFLGKVLGRPDPADRLAGSLAVALWAAERGAAIIRTHDVAATRDALATWATLKTGTPAE